MKLVQPVAVTNASLTSSSVPETDYPAWSAIPTYALGDRAIVAHRIYESVIGGNVGNDPTSSTQWIDIGPTNRWAMFDQAAGPRTSATVPITVTITPVAPVDTLGLVDIDGATVRVQVTGGSSLFDETRDDGDRSPIFAELPTGQDQSITVTVTPAAGQTAAIGKLVIGDAFDLGVTETGPTVAIVDYSKRTTDDFGVTTVVERGWAKKISTRSRLESSAVDEVQRRVAAARATAALWIGDDGYECLTVYGFFSDFNEDVTIGSNSYCSLTIQGLPSSGDAGDVVDPAPDQPSDFLVIRPVVVTGDILDDSSVPENDYPQWTSVETYPLGGRVLRGANHRIYESVIANNANHDPDADGSTQWIDIGPTNRWAMFDQALGSVTTATGHLTVYLDPNAPVTALAVTDTDAATVRVQAPGYDRTQPTVVDGVRVTTLTFLDLTVELGERITVTVSAATEADALSVGTMLIGTVEPLGVTEDAPTVTIKDFSVTDTDDFGNTMLLERAWAKNMAAKSLISTAAIENLVRRMASIRAVPSLWIGQEGFDSLTIYGFFRDFSIEAAEPVSVCTFTIEGLSTAGATTPLIIPPTAIIGGTRDPQTGKAVGGVPASEVAALPAQVADVGAELEAARADVADAQGDIVNVRADLAAEVARAEADTASIIVITDQLQEGLSGNIADLSEEKITRADADHSLTLRVDAQESRLGEAEANITENNATLTAADSALADRATSLETRMGSAESTISDNFTTLSSATEALANRDTSLETRMGSAESAIENNFTTLSNADEALANQSSSLETRMGTAESAISDNFTALSNADSALATRASGLETRMGNAEGSISDNFTTLSNATSALATRQTTTESQVNDPATGNAALAGRVGTEETTRASETSSLATRATNVEARAGSLESRTSIVETSAADSATQLASARLELSAVSPGGRAQITIHSDSASGAGVDIVGDVKITGATSAGTTVVSGDGVYVYGPSGNIKVAVGLKP